MPELLDPPQGSLASASAGAQTPPVPFTFAELCCAAPRTILQPDSSSASVWTASGAPEAPALMGRGSTSTAMLSGVDCHVESSSTTRCAEFNFIDWSDWICSRLELYRTVMLNTCGEGKE